MEKYLDAVMVPLGLLLQGAYHCWLLFTILHYPDRTVIGLNAEVKRRWVQLMMADSLKNGVLAVQTIRNNIMASTVLATTAITLASLITAFVSASTASPSIFVYGNTSAAAHSVKYFAISLCFLLAFLCNVQSIRYYAHVSFLVTSASAAAAAAAGEGAAAASAEMTVEYVARSLNRGGYFWSLGLRAFYVSFTLFLWVFGPIPMLASSAVMCCLLYFLDTTTEITRSLHLHCHRHHHHHFLHAKEDGA